MKQNKAEKLLAGVLSISLAMGVSVMPAFAAQVQGPPYEDMSRVYLTKNYELTNTGTISPEETFTFAIEPGTVTDASDGIKAGDYMPIVGDVTYAQGEAGSASKTKKIEIQLPEYDSVGVYTYIIHEVEGNSAGVTYYGDAILLRVTVIEQDGKLRIAAFTPRTRSPPARARRTTSTTATLPVSWKSTRTSRASWAIRRNTSSSGCS